MKTPVSMPVEPAYRPLRRDAERNRQRILQAAREVFAERGLTASLDDIARQAEVGVGTVHRRFPDKQMLVDALFEDRMTEVVAAFERGIAHPDPWEGFASTLETILAMQADDRGPKDLLLSEGGACHGIDAAQRRIAPLGARLLERAQADGGVRPDVVASDIPLMQLALGSLIDATRGPRPGALAPLPRPQPRRPAHHPRRPHPAPHRGTRDRARAAGQAGLSRPSLKGAREARPRAVTASRGFAG